MEGKPAGEWGPLEWAKTIHWKVLVTALLLAVVTFFTSHVVPVMEGAGGAWAVLSAVLLIAIRALQQYWTNNEGTEP